MTLLELARQPIYEDSPQQLKEKLASCERAFLEEYRLKETWMKRAMEVAPTQHIT